MKKPLIGCLICLALFAGCYAEPAKGLPDPTMEVVVPAEEKEAIKAQETKKRDDKDSEDVEAKATLGLDLSSSKVFETFDEEDMDTYHGSIEVLYIENKDALEEMYTSQALKPLRDHLETVRYNTQPGTIGLVSEPDSIYAVCSKLNKLPETYKPEDLVEPDIPFSFQGEDMKRNLRLVPAQALEALVGAATKDGLAIVGVSGYRSYQRQNSIYSYNVSTRGVEETDKVSARPGHSEHQSGLAMDVSAASVGYALEESFGETPEGQWLKEHAHEYGFVIRYPEAYISNTGYNYEPWHLRYIGPGVAEFLHRYDATLEMLYATYLREE